LGSTLLGTASTNNIMTSTAADAGSYTVDVNSTTCPALVTSSAAVVVVNALPSITTQPVTPSPLCAGASTILSVAATGTGLSYQWKKGTTNVGTNANTFEVTSMTDAAESTSIYTVVVSGTCPTPSPLISTEATVVINALPAITAQPEALTKLCAGESTTLIAAATGTGLMYQWKKGTDNVGINADSYDVTSATDAVESTSVYTLTVSGTCPTTALIISNTATVLINALPKITAQPSAANLLCAGENVTLRVAATGTGLAYQWKKGTTDVGTNANTYDVTTMTTDAASAPIYTVVVSGTCLPSVTSDPATVTVNALPKIATPPVASKTLCAGESTTLSVVATGTGLTYQWKKDLDIIANATSSSYTVNSAVGDAASTSVYTVIVSGACTPSVSASSTVVINALPMITATGQPTASTTLCAGENTTLSVTATGTNLAYQWRKNGNIIADSTRSAFTVKSLNADAESTSKYTVVVSGTCPTTPSPLISTEATVIINALPKITVQPLSKTLCAGEGRTLTVDATGTGLKYQWKKDGNDITIAGNVRNYEITSMTTDPANAPIYTVFVSGTCGPSVTSDPATVTINALPSITLQPVASNKICAGTSTTLSVTAAGSGLTYQWKKEGANIATATAASYVVTSLAADTASLFMYTVMVSGTCTPSVMSEKAAVVVSALPKITAQPMPATTICAGIDTTLSVGATGTGLTYQWKKGGVDIAGATAASYKVISAATDIASAFVYTVVVSGTCGPTAKSADAVVTVNALLKVTAQPAALTTICIGSATTLSVTATGTGLTYKWRKDSVDIAGATSANYTIAASVAKDSGTYTVVVGSTCSRNDTSTNAVLVIDPKPSAITGDTAVNATFKTTFKNDVLGGTWSSSNPAIATVDSTGVVTGVLFGTATISYTVSNACGVITVKKDITVIRNFVKVSLKAFLQGPYNANNGFMEATLRVNGYLPSVEPYTGMANFTHKGSGGGELFDNPAVSTTIGNNAIVDWVFIELRDKTDSKKVVATRSALLQRDGDIVDTDGTSALTINDVIVGDYFIAVRHRNHLGFRTATAQPLKTTSLSLNFTDNSTPLFGTKPLKLIGAAYVMYSGNGDGNGAINAIDKNKEWLPKSGQFNYLRGDFNMDGAVNALDITDHWRVNNSQVQQLD
jgi:Bacterial Ig-like domain (group 2)